MIEGLKDRVKRVQRRQGRDSGLMGPDLKLPEIEFLPMQGSASFIKLLCALLKSANNPVHGFVKDDAD